MIVGHWFQKIIKRIVSVLFQVEDEVVENFLDVGVMFLGIWGNIRVSWEKQVEFLSSFREDSSRFFSGTGGCFFLRPWFVSSWLQVV